MSASAYGTRLDLLPRSIVRLKFVPGSGPRWIARDGVTVLDHREHLEAENRALGGMPRRSDGTVDWDRCRELVTSTRAVTPGAVESEVRRFVDGDEDVLVLTGLFTVPSFRIVADMAAGVIGEMASQTITEVWVRQEGREELLEYSYFRDTIVRADLAAAE